MDANRLKNIFILVIAGLVALYLGVSAATAQFETLLWVVGGAIVFICLLLGRKVWLLLPLGTSLALVLPIPGRFDSGFIAMALIVVFTFPLILMRRFPAKWRFGELEFWCLALIVMLGQAYLRNPVGLNILGTSSVGAKPYAIVGVTILVSLIISVIKINPSELRWWVRLTMLGSLINFVVGMVALFAPLSVGYYLYASFSTDVAAGGQSGVEGTVDAGYGRATRLGSMRIISKNLALWISSKISPLAALLRPMWLLLILIALGMAGLSGFRSHVGLVGLTFAVGVFYWSGVRGVMISSIICLTGLAGIAAVNAVSPLPANVQRAFSFLPGNWGEQYTENAEGSTEWRIEMWKEVLTSDRYIQNKWFGDGLGFTRSQLDQMNAVMAEINRTGHTRMGITGFDVKREAYLVSGNYHSGPVSTIRTIGYVGLLVLVIGMIRMAIYAHRVIVSNRGTAWFSTTLFICIPLIVAPIYWIFVFGTFERGAEAMLLGTALIRLLQESLVQEERESGLVESAANVIDLHPAKV